MRYLLPISFIFLSNLLQSQSSSIPPPSTTVAPLNVPPNKAPKDNTRVVQPPESIRRKFKEDYPGIQKVSWKTQGEEYWVTFTDPKSKLSHILVYNAAGKVIHEEEEIRSSDYPEAINAYYKKKFPGEKYIVWKFTNADHQSNYIIHRGELSHFFDQQGKFLKSEKIRQDTKK